MRDRKPDLAAAPDFDGILAIVEACAVPGFGQLCVYDTALRLGCWLRRLPERVYLHAGTRKGARALVHAASGPCIDVAELPPELRPLRPDEVEDFLCIYKDEFSAREGARRCRGHGLCHPVGKRSSGC